MALTEEASIFEWLDISITLLELIFTIDSAAMVDMLAMDMLSSVTSAELELLEKAVCMDAKIGRSVV